MVQPGWLELLGSSDFASGKSIDVNKKRREEKAGGEGGGHDEAQIGAGLK